MLVLHHLEKSRSFRVLWALEELGLPYDVIFYQRRADFSAPESLRDVHPLGKAPVLFDEEIRLAESAAILEYLHYRYDTDHCFKPISRLDMYQYNYWLHYSEGSLMPLLVFKLVTGKLDSEQVPLLARPLTKKIAEQLQSNYSTPRLKEHMIFIERHLYENPYFAGARFSFADIQMTFTLQSLFTLLPDAMMPNAKEYLKRVEQRTAYQRAIEINKNGGNR